MNAHLHGLMFLGHIFWLGLIGLFLVFVVTRFKRHGYCGPVRWDPAREFTPGEGEPGGHPFHGRHGHHRPAPQPSPEDAALATLAERLATGDISVEEYLERTSVLRGSKPEA